MEMLAFLNALTWAGIAIVLDLAILLAFYLIDTVRSERPARKRHFGGV